MGKKGHWWTEGKKNGNERTMECFDNVWVINYQDVHQNNQKSSALSKVLPDYEIGTRQKVLTGA